MDNNPYSDLPGLYWEALSYWKRSKAKVSNITLYLSALYAPGKPMSTSFWTNGYFNLWGRRDR